MHHIRAWWHRVSAPEEHTLAVWLCALVIATALFVALLALAPGGVW